MQYSSINVHYISKFGSPPLTASTPLPAPPDAARFVVAHDDVGQTLPALLRRRGLAASWNEAKRMVATGKVRVGGQVVLDEAHRPREGAEVELRRSAPRYEPRPGGRIVYDDAQVVVLDKPAGISSVPYEERETGTAMDLVRAHWRHERKPATDTPLHIVHRIDKDTSGLLAFAKSKAAELALATLFRAHDIERTYLCVAHGAVRDDRIESRLVEDRGDGLRGSTREPNRGKRAVTHVRALEAIGARATLCEVRLETGKTHQIRIHLAERGHPLVGERVYVRDFVRRGGEPLPSTRLLLHAATLGFVHPTTGEALRFSSPLPSDYLRALDKLRRS